MSSGQRTAGPLGHSSARGKEEYTLGEERDRRKEERRGQRRGEEEESIGERKRGEGRIE